MSADDRDQRLVHFLRANAPVVPPIPAELEEHVMTAVAANPQPTHVESFVPASSKSSLPLRARLIAIASASCLLAFAIHFDHRTQLRQLDESRLAVEREEFWNEAFAAVIVPDQEEEAGNTPRFDWEL